MPRYLDSILSTWLVARDARTQGLRVSDLRKLQISIRVCQFSVMLLTNYLRKLNTVTLEPRIMLITEIVSSLFYFRIHLVVTLRQLSYAM